MCSISKKSEKKIDQTFAQMALTGQMPVLGMCEAFDDGLNVRMWAPHKKSEFLEVHAKFKQN